MPTGATGARRTKVLYLMDALHGGDRVGGTEGQVLQLVAGLDRRRFEPHLAVFRPTPDVEGPGTLPCPATVLDITRLSSAGGVARLLRLAARLRAERFDLVHLFLNDAAVAAPLFCRLGGAAVVGSRRDMGFWYTPSALRALRISNRFVTRIVANSEAVKRNVHRHERIPLERIDVVCNGHDPARFDAAPLAGFRERLGIGPEDPIVGMVANLYAWKRPGDLIRAFAAVGARHAAAHLVFVGTGAMHDSLRLTARTLGVAGRVHLIGGVADAVPLIRHFSVGVLCSESEGLSNAVIEYLGTGTPAICTSVGGNPEIVTDGVTGFLIEPGDVAALTERLDFLLSHPEVCVMMGRKGRMVAGRLTTRHMVAAHMDLYERLACAGRTPDCISRARPARL